MKYLRITAAIFTLALLAHTCAYLNLKVSEKYETDLMATHVEVSGMYQIEKAKALKRIEETETKINRNWRANTIFPASPLLPGFQ